MWSTILDFLTGAAFVAVLLTIIRLIFALLAFVLAIGVVVLLLMDMAQGGPLTIAVIMGLAHLYAAIYAGLLSLSQNLHL